MDSLVKEQIEHSKALIQSGRLTDLRLALILLDNAAELLMYQTLSPVFSTDDEFQHIRQTMALLNMPIPEVFAPPYTPEERHAADREFEPMLRIIEYRLKLISSAERSILKIAHKLRRDAFHRGHLRQEILQPVCLLLYQTVLNLTTSLPLQDAYGRLRPKNAAPVKPQPSESPSDISFDHRQLCETLADDVVERINKLLKKLSGFFIVDEAIDAYLFRMQFGDTLPTQVPALDETQLELAFQEWKKTATPAITVQHLKRLLKMGENVRTAKQSSNALVHYWSVDERLSKAERKATSYLEQLDRRIERQREISRGK